MDASIGVTNFTSAAIVVYFINRLKASPWFPLLQKDRTMLNRSFSVVVAFFVSVGIHYQWNNAYSTANGGSITIDLPGLYVLALGVWHWINQYAFQETLHQLTKPKFEVAVAGQPKMGQMAPIPDQVKVPDAGLKP
jgi:hypothetical protein